MENNEIKDMEKNVADESINEEVVNEETNEVIDEIEETKDAAKVVSALNALKANLVKAGVTVKGKGKIVLTTVSGKAVAAANKIKDSKFGKAVGNGANKVKDSKFGKFVGNGTNKVVVYVKGHKKGVITVAAGAGLIAGLAIGSCSIYKHFEKKANNANENPVTNEDVTPTPTAMPTATPVVTPTVMPTPTAVPTQAPVAEMNEVQKMVSARADELMKEFAEKGLTVKGATDEELKSMIEATYALVNIETLGEDINEIAGTPAERKALYALAKEFMHKLALHNAKSLAKSAQYISVASLSDIKSDKDIISALEYIPTYKKALYAGELHDTCADAYAELYLRFFKEQSNDNEVKFEDLTIGGKMLSEIALGEATNFVLGSSDYLSDKLARELETLSKKVFTGADFATINSIYAKKENTLTK